MNKSVYLGLLMLDLSKVVKYEFWYDYVKPKHGENAELCYMEDIYKDVGKDIETRFDTSNFELDRLLPKRKIKKVIGLMKDELEG